MKKYIDLEVKPFQQYTDKPAPGGILMTNPPYGERIKVEDMDALYAMIGERLKHVFTGFDAYILSYKKESFDNIGLKPSKRFFLYNGALECEMREYEIFAGKRDDRPKDERLREKENATMIIMPSEIPKKGIAAQNATNAPLTMIHQPANRVQKENATLTTSLSNHANARLTAIENHVNVRSTASENHAATAHSMASENAIMINLLNAKSAAILRKKRWTSATAENLRVGNATAVREKPLGESEFREEIKRISKKNEAASFMYFYKRDRIKAIHVISLLPLQQTLNFSLA